MALRAGYYGLKRRFKDKLESIALSWDNIISSLLPIEADQKLNAFNILPITFDYSISGVTTTVNSDKSITFNGTPASNGNYIIGSITKDFAVGDKLFFSGCPAGGSATTYSIFVVFRDSSNVSTGTLDVYEVGAWAIVPNNTVKIDVYVKLNSGKKIDGVVKAMVSYTPGPYVMHTESNQTLSASVSELTTSASDQKTAINAIITAATGAADFAAFKTAMGAITPVTRSLSLTKEDITEEVKEDVEPEKTVTKKRTTKKTEEV